VLSVHPHRKTTTRVRDTWHTEPPKQVWQALESDQPVVESSGRLAVQHWCHQPGTPSPELNSTAGLTLPRCSVMSSVRGT